MDELATDADILDDAGALALSAHILRHTLATDLLRAGVDIVAVAELLGHTCLDTTRRYTLKNQHLRVRVWEAGDVVDAVLRTYDRLPEEIRAQVPLRRVWMLSDAGL